MRSELRPGEKPSGNVSASWPRLHQGAAISRLSSRVIQAPSGQLTVTWRHKWLKFSPVSRLSGPGHQDDLVGVLLSVEGDVQNLADTLVRIVAKLNEELRAFREEEPGEPASGGEDQQVRPGPDSDVASRPLDPQPAADPSSRVEEPRMEAVEDHPHPHAAPQDDQRDNGGGACERMEEGDLIVG